MSRRGVSRALAHIGRGRDVRSDEGAATAEYAVVTVAAAGLGGVLIKLLTSDWFISLLKMIFEWVIRAALSLLGG